MLKTSCIAYLLLKCLSLCITGVLKPVTGNMHTTIWFQEQWTFFFFKKTSPFFMAPITRSSSFHTGPVIWIQTRLVVMSAEWPIRTKFLVSIQFPMERSQAAETTIPSGSAVSGISHGVSCPSATELPRVVFSGQGWNPLVTVTRDSFAFLWLLYAFAENVFLWRWYGGTVPTCFGVLVGC